MEQETVVYTNNIGLEEVRRVPNGLQPKDYDKGILIGPPDISSLKLKRSELVKLNHALIDAEFLNYRDLTGKRGQLLRILREVTGKEDVRELRTQLLILYQREMIPE